MLKFLIYILRLTAFVLIVSFYYCKLADSIMYKIENFIVFIAGGDNSPIDEGISMLIGIIFGPLSLIGADIFVTYIFAKICGLFKSLDNLKKWQIFLILFTVSIFLYKLSDILHVDRKFNIGIVTSILSVSLSLIPAYLFYLLFNFLSKKHPTTFGKIGYYTSIDFVKDIITKIKPDKLS